MHKNKPVHYKYSSSHWYFLNSMSVSDFTAVYWLVWGSVDILWLLNVPLFFSDCKERMEGENHWVPSPVCFCNGWTSRQLSVIFLYLTSTFRTLALMYCSRRGGKVSRTSVCSVCCCQRAVLFRSRVQVTAGGLVTCPHTDLVTPLFLYLRSNK